MIFETFAKVVLLFFVADVCIIVIVLFLFLFLLFCSLFNFLFLCLCHHLKQFHRELVSSVERTEFVLANRASVFQSSGFEDLFQSSTILELCGSE